MNTDETIADTKEQDPKRIKLETQFEYGEIATRLEFKNVIGIGRSPDSFNALLHAIRNWADMAMRSTLSFSQLRSANMARILSYSKGTARLAFNHTLEEWTPAQWACALAGEVGELCNLIKKDFRGRPGDTITERMLADEIADVAIYLDLLAARLGINLAEAVREKFNSKSDQVGSSVKL